MAQFDISSISVFATFSPGHYHEDRRDVDVYFGDKLVGGVTLVKDHNGDWGSWGAAVDTWCSSDLVKAVDAAAAASETVSVRSILAEIETLAARECDEF